MNAAVLTVSGPTETHEISLNPCGIILGRGSDCDVILDDAAVSRHHARIAQDSFGRWVIEDLGSRNGVLVAGSVCGPWLWSRAKRSVYAPLPCLCRRMVIKSLPLVRLSEVL